MTFTSFPSFNITRRTALWVMLLCALACGLMQWLTPFQMDDLGYGKPFKNAMVGSAPGMSFSEGIEFIKWHWAEANGRIGDKLLIWILTDVPKWLFGCIAGLACLAIFVFGSRMAFGSLREHPLRSIALTFAYTVFLPWGGYMFVANMFLNYVLGSALAIIVMWLFVRTPSLPVPAYLSYPAIFLLATLTGGWHEAYSVAAIPAMILFMLIMRGKGSALRWCLLTGTVLGLCIILSSPGFWHRIDSDTPYKVWWAGYKIQGILKGANILLMLPVLLAVGAGLPYVRRQFTRLSTALFAMGLMLIAGALVIYLNSLYVLRVFWYSDVLTLPVIALLGAMICVRLRPGLRLTAIGAMILFLALHYTACIPWQQRISREHNEIVAAYAKSADGVVFHDFHGRGFGPDITLRKARIFAFTYDMRQYLLPFYRSDNSYLSLVPTCLRTIPDSLFSEPSQTKYFRGYAVSNDSTLRDKRVIYRTFISDKGVRMSLPTIVNGFRSATGTQLYYLEPDERQSGGANLIETVKSI